MNSTQHTSLPTVATPDMSYRNTLRKEWNANIAVNYPTLAENLTHNVATHVLMQFNKRIGDEYELPVTSKKPFTFSLSLDVVYHAKEIRSFITEESKPLDEWLTKFTSKHENNLEQHETLKGADRAYFLASMAPIGAAAETALNRLLTAYTNDPEHPEQKNLQFRVKWHPPSDQSTTFGSSKSNFDARAHCLVVELWFKEEAPAQGTEHPKVAKPTIWRKIPSFSSLSTRAKIAFGVMLLFATTLLVFRNKDSIPFFR